MRRFERLYDVGYGEKKMLFIYKIIILIFSIALPLTRKFARKFARKLAHNVAQVSRFLTQVTTDNISLTGMKFFSVTRGLVLTVSTTIQTS